MLDTDTELKQFIDNYLANENIVIGNKIILSSGQKAILVKDRFQNHIWKMKENHFCITISKFSIEPFS